ncbi:hypothetical protein FKP32DRAFT_1091728 [Trametes sanguinea]|nr:hypothetical protein FKP32DRAFT_1091728 [Trametes sanguinea]
MARSAIRPSSTRSSRTMTATRTKGSPGPARSARRRPVEAGKASKKARVGYRRYQGRAHHQGCAHHRRRAHREEPDRRPISSLTSIVHFAESSALSKGVQQNMTDYVTLLVSYGTTSPAALQQDSVVITVLTVSCLWLHCCPVALRI